ncbi:hypothetical protein IT418_01840 [bacterium]|nr:hypothetical protein [bacterium]
MDIEQTHIKELPPIGTLTLVVSNHIFSRHQLHSLRELRRVRRDIYVVCNAGFALPLQLLGFHPIPVNSVPEKAKLEKYTWSKLVYANSKIY